MGQIAIAKKYLPGCRFDEPQDCAAKSRLATTGFTNQTERLAGVNVDRHSVNGFYATASRHCKVNLQVPNSDQWIAVSAFDWRRHLYHTFKVFLSTHKARGSTHFLACGGFMQEGQNT